jgi:hypothetical protein
MGAMRRGEWWAPLKRRARASRRSGATPLRWCALAVVLMVGVRSADAVVVLEAYVGPRPGKASATLEPLFAELEAQGITARPNSVRTRLRDARTRAGIVNPSITLTELIKRINDATKLLHRRSYVAATGLFESALKDAHDNVAILIADRERSQPMMMEAWIGLAMCRFRMGNNAGGEQAMQEAARSFPNQETNVRNSHGMEPAERYRKATKQLQERGAGKLVITVNDPSALIFVNEWTRPQNAIFEAEVLPGPHRVLVQIPGTHGWRHDIEVMPDRETQLQIDVRFDAAVMIEDDRVGFLFSSIDAARSNIIPYTQRLVISDEKGVIIVTLTEWNGRPAVVASMYRIDTGVHVRGYAVALGGLDDEARLRALAKGLIDRHMAERLAERYQIVPVTDHLAPLPTPKPAPRAPSRARWGLLGGAALAAGAGAALVYVDNQDRCDPTCPTIYPTKPYGYASFAAAGAMAITAAYLFYRDTRARPSSERTSIGIAPTSSGIFATVGRRF